MKEEDINDVENRIIEAAKKVFIAKGFDSATMGDIATEAGIGRTSLNYYFRTKEMLFNTILDKLMYALLPNLDQIVDEKSTYKEKTRKIADLYLTTLRKNDLIPLFVVNELQRDPQHFLKAVMKDPERIQPIIKLRKFVELEMERGNLRKIPIVDLISTLVSLIIFPFLVRQPLTQMFLDGNQEEFDEFLDRRVDLVGDILDNLLIPKEE